jgi:tetratricopeptide (TPR) repeat protein
MFQAVIVSAHLVGVVLAFATASLAQGASSPAERRQAIIAQLARGDVDSAEKAMALWQAEGGVAADDLAVLGIASLRAQRMDRAEHWFRVAVDASAGREDQSKQNNYLWLALVLWETGRRVEAVAALERAAAHKTFDHSASFRKEEELSERWADGRERFVLYAEALEAAKKPAAAERYRKVAAAGCIKAGLWAVREGDNQKALEYFAESEQTLPLQMFSVDVQMTVLRDLVVAYGKTGRLLHAVAAVERLFELCRPDAAGRWSCPEQGVASDPFGPGATVFSVRLDGRELHPVADVHMKLIAKLGERVFQSVSWQPLNGNRRVDSSSGEFVGATAGREPTEGEERDVVEGCTPKGASYAEVSGWEEDRVEFERCWPVLEEDAVFRVKLRKDIEAGKVRLAVKGFLSRLQFAVRFVRIEAVLTLAKNGVAGVTLSELRTAVSKSKDEPSRVAMAAGERLLAAVEGARTWKLTR